MLSGNKPFVVLMADDDEDDRLLAHEALLESKETYDMHFVKDGVELMEYLRGEGSYKEQPAPKPGLILLDLNMPRKDGREVLAELKADPDLLKIPVVILTTSNSQEDLQYSHDLGAAFYQTKPVTFCAMVDFMKKLTAYCNAQVFNPTY